MARNRSFHRTQEMVRKIEREGMNRQRERIPTPGPTKADLRAQAEAAFKSHPATKIPAAKPAHALK